MGEYKLKNQTPTSLQHKVIGTRFTNLHLKNLKSNEIYKSNVFSDFEYQVRRIVDIER